MAKKTQKRAADPPVRKSTDIFLHRRFILSCCEAVWPMMVWRHGGHLGRRLLKITLAPPCSSLGIRYYIPCGGVFEACFILHTSIGGKV